MRVAQVKSGPHGLRAVLGWADSITLIMTALVSLYVVGQMTQSAARGDTADAVGTVSTVAASVLACADAALAPVAPALAAACDVFLDDTIGTVSRASFGAAAAAVAALAVASSRSFIESLAGAGARAAWAARMSAEYGIAVTPGASCNSSSSGGGGDLVVSYCATGRGSSCPPPQRLFECLDPASAAAAAAHGALASGAAQSTLLGGAAAGLFQVFAPVAASGESAAAAGHGQVNASTALLMLTLDVGALFARASGVGRFGDVAVTVTDAASGGVVYAAGVAAGAASLVRPVGALRTLMGRNLTVLVAAGAGFVAAYESARGHDAAILMVFVPVRVVCACASGPRAAAARVRLCLSQSSCGQPPRALADNAPRLSRSLASPRLSSCCSTCCRSAR